MADTDTKARVRDHATILPTNPLVVHVSLRDLAPEIVLASTNIVDDIEHCLKANTSLHLAEQLSGHRKFVTGTLGDVMSGRVVTMPADRPLMFSPFGLGVLDLAVGKYVYDHVSRSGDLQTIDGFFHELRRHGHGAAGLSTPSYRPTDPAASSHPHRLTNSACSSHNCGSAGVSADRGPLESIATVTPRRPCCAGTGATTQPHAADLVPPG